MELLKIILVIGGYIFLLLTSGIVLNFILNRISHEKSVKLSRLMRRTQVLSLVNVKISSS